MMPILHALSEGWIEYVQAMLWQSSLVMIAVWAVYLACRRRSAALRYALLCLIILKLLLPTSLHSITGAGHWIGVMADRFAKPEPVAATEVSGPLPDLPRLTPHPEAGELLLANMDVESVATAPESTTPPVPPIHVPSVLFMVWIAVTALLGLALLAHIFRTWRRFSHATEVTDPEVVELLADCVAELGICRGVRLCAFRSGILLSCEGHEDDG